MEQSEALKILLNLLQTKEHSDEEKEALRVAIGILSMTAPAKNRIKSMKENRERRKEQSFIKR